MRKAQLARNQPGGRPVGRVHGVLPVAPPGIALAGTCIGAAPTPGGRAAARRLDHADLALAVARQHLRRRVAEAVAVPGLHQRPARLHRIQKGALDEVLLPWCGTSSTSAQRLSPRATRACSCAASMSPTSSAVRRPLPGCAARSSWRWGGWPPA
jgi:hypothetical protein